MSDETLTIPDVSERTGLTRATIRNYTSGRYEPALPVTYEKGPGGVQVRITLEAFEVWHAQYKAKEPKGARLHANAGRKHEK